MIRKHKRRYFASLLFIIAYGLFMAVAGVYANSFSGDPIPIFLGLFFGAPFLAYVLGIVWRYNITLSLIDDEADTSDTVTHQQTEKRKRQALDDVLRDLSDDDLVRLRQRLSDGSIDDEILYDQLVGDDGESIRYN
ncbi:MAG: hypothetical protein WBC91_06350 [Phototrophicaceae bacterium]